MYKIHLKLNGSDSYGSSVVLNCFREMIIPISIEIFYFLILDIQTLALFRRNKFFDGSQVLHSSALDFSISRHSHETSICIVRKSLMTARNTPHLL